MLKGLLGNKQPEKPVAGDPRKGAPPSQKELFFKSLRPGTHVDLVLERDDESGAMLARASMVQDITRDRRLYLAQTTPPLHHSRIGQDLEVTFLCRFDDIPGGRWLRTGYRAKLKAIESILLSSGMVEPVLVVDLPTRLEVTTLRMHFRLTPPTEYGLRAYLAASQLRDLINNQVNGFERRLKRELWNQDRHPKRIIRELTDALQALLETVYERTANVKQAQVVDLSEGGAYLVYDREIVLEVDSVHDLTLVWGDETMDVQARIVRSGELTPEPHPHRVFSSVQFLNLNLEDRRRLAKLLQEMLRKELARRAGEE